MKPNLKVVTDNLKKCILEEEILGINQFVEFADNFASPDLADEAVIKKMAFLFTNDKNKRALLVKEIFELIDKIESGFEDSSKLKAGFDEKIQLIQEKISEEYAKKYSENVVVSCQHVSKTFKGRFKFQLTDVSIELKLGEITAIFGENASGKTTLIKQLIGQIAPDKGRILYPYFKQTDTNKVDWNYVKHEIAYVPQELGEWYGNLKENLHLEATIHGIKGKENEKEVEFIIHRLGLEKYCDRAWNELSGGFKLRFALAKALVWRPKVLILDEPLANLDPKAQLIVLNDLRAFARSIKNPMAVLLTSQTLDETEYVADKILFLKDDEGKGSKVAYYGDKSDLEKDRTQNKFTINGSLSLQNLENVLYKLKPIEINHTGLEYVIKMPLDVTARDMITCLSGYNYEIKSFTNISQSIKSMFV